MKNKKGFTLIELLAVIVILAILATAAFTLVLPQIEKARKKSFISEAANMIESSEIYFANHIKVGERCVKISKLASEGLIKNPKGKTGAVAYNPNNGEFKIIFDNSGYKTNGWKKIDELREGNGDPTNNVIASTGDVTPTSTVKLWTSNMTCE